MCIQVEKESLTDMRGHLPVLMDAWVSMSPSGHL